MREEWIDIHPGDGTLVVPEIPGGQYDNSLMWLVIGQDETIQCHNVGPGYETGWWSKHMRFYGTPIENLEGLSYGSSWQRHWINAYDRHPPEGEKLYLVLDTTSSELYFSPGKDIGKSRKLYWYDGFVRATLHKRS